MLADFSTLLAEQGGPEGAVDICAAAVRALPGRSELLNNLGIAQFAAGELRESLASFQAALTLDPTSATARYNRSFSRLLLGDFRGHCADYEARFAGSGLWAQGSAKLDELPLWQGEPLAGRNLLVHAEQGFGDTLQYIRFIPLLAARQPARLTVHVQPQLLPALQSLRRYAELHPIGSVIGPCHFSIPLMSVPHRLGIDWPSLPAWHPYLAPDPRRVAHWRARLAQAETQAAAHAGAHTAVTRDTPAAAHTRPALRVGLVWRGAAANARDRERSLELPDLHLLAQPAVQFVSLQKGPAAAAAHTDAVLRPLPLGEELEDFADTAALISCLDLVISVDTAVAHLAGALGHPTWVLATRTDPKWLLEREDSPWYPSVRLFRQRVRGRWQAAVMDLAYALQQRALQRPEDSADARLAAARQTGVSADQALAEVRRAVAAAPTRHDVHLAHARLLAERERDLEATTSFLHAAARAPESAEVPLGLARLLQGRGQAPAALPWFQQALAARARQHRAPSPAGRTDMALPDSRRLPADAALLRDVARCQLDAHDPLGALRRAAESLALDPTTAAARTIAQRCLQQITPVVPAIAPAAQRWLRQPDGAASFELAEALIDAGLPLPALGLYRLCLADADWSASNAHARPALRGLCDCLVAQGEWADLCTLAQAEPQTFCEEPDLASDLATAQWKLGALDAAADGFAAVLARVPDHLAALLHGSAVALARADGELAHGLAARARAISPGHPEALMQLAAVAEWQGQDPAAREYLQAVRQDEPEHARARFNLALLDLRAGHWGAGWLGFETRPEAEGVRRWLGARSDEAPRWEGEDLQGRHLVVCAEQGLGDTLQCLRLLPLLARARPARITLQVQDALLPWLRSLPTPLPQGIFELMPRGLPLPPYQRFVPIMSLPRMFGVEPASLPPPRLPPADPQRRSHWRHWLDQHSGRRVGLCWSGNPDFARDHERSLPEPLARALLEATGTLPIQWVSLVHGKAGQALAEAGARVPVLSPALGLGDTAALVAELDLVISVDTAVVHVAGGLGVPTWVLLPRCADWRWGHAESGSAWYPQVRQFRQRQPGQWPA
ncbi:MAG: glycosyltransferase family 9 protein, partial [Leptothrix sp. (in: b-proteobacteria)]